MRNTIRLLVGDIYMILKVENGNLPQLVYLGLLPSYAVDHFCFVCLEDVFRGFHIWRRYLCMLAVLLVQLYDGVTCAC